MGAIRRGRRGRKWWLLALAAASLALDVALLVGAATRGGWYGLLWGVLCPPVGFIALIAVVEFIRHR